MVALWLGDRLCGGTLARRQTLWWHSGAFPLINLNRNMMILHSQLEYLPYHGSTSSCQPHFFVGLCNFALRHFLFWPRL